MGDTQSWQDVGARVLGCARAAVLGTHRSFQLLLSASLLCSNVSVFFRSILRAPRAVDVSGCRGLCIPELLHTAVVLPVLGWQQCVPNIFAVQFETDSRSVC